MRQFSSAEQTTHKALAMNPFIPLLENGEASQSFKSEETQQVTSQKRIVTVAATSNSRRKEQTRGSQPVRESR
jgi:hypothetical protein